MLFIMSVEKKILYYFFFTLFVVEGCYCVYIPATCGVLAQPTTLRKMQSFSAKFWKSALRACVARNCANELGNFQTFRAPCGGTLALRHAGSFVRFSLLPLLLPPFSHLTTFNSLILNGCESVSFTLIPPRQGFPCHQWICHYCCSFWQRARQ